MGELVYSAIASLDGYVADESGRFDWAEPDEEVHAHVNDLQRPVGTHLCGRRLYEVMAYWDTAPTGPGAPEVEREFAWLWQAADTVVYSRTLESVSGTRARLEREFDPAAVRRLKDVSDRDLTVGGAVLAAAALRAGLVDELQLFLVPVVVGGGTPVLPAGVRVPLRLVDERRFAGGVVHLRYRVG